MIQYVKKRGGYALPTILIMSLSVLIVITALLATTSASFRNVVIDHYQTLADEAAEAGTAYAASCMTSVAGHVQSWGPAKSRPNLTPAGDCTGANNSLCSVATVFKDSSVRTCFEVGDLIYGTNFVAQSKSIGYAQVLSGSTVVKTYTSIQMKIQTWPTDVNSTSVSSGMYFTCAVVNFNPWCFGHNGVGQLGNGVGIGDSYNNTRNTASATADSFFPTRVDRTLIGENNSKKVSAGGYHACVLTNDGKVYCWGLNIFGQLGNNSTSDAIVPVAVTLPAPATDIVTTEFNSCAIAGGKIYCWGRTNEGVVGNNCSGSACTSPGYVKVPTEVSNGTGFALPANYSASSLSTSGGAVQNVCAIVSGKAYCWGSNAKGQIGDNSTTTRNAPTAVLATGVLSGKTVTSISLDGHGSISGILDIGTDTHACVVAGTTATNGAVYCWGYNSSGQLGNNSTTTSKVPVAVNTTGALKNIAVQDVRVGSYHSCALSVTNTAAGDKGGAVYCWGQDTYGQVGDGSYASPSTTTVPNKPNQQTPVKVSTDTTHLTGTNVIALGGGVNRACAITDTQYVYCWGVNVDGQVGDGTSGNYKVAPTEALFLRPDNNRYLF